MKTRTRTPRRRWLAPASLGLLCLLFLSSCASGGKLTTLKPKGENARNIDKLFGPVFWIAVGVFALVFGSVIYMWLRFRVKEHRDDDWPDQVHGNNKLEIGWTIVPAVLLAVIAVFSMATLWNLDKTPKNSDMTVVVIGQQWWWEFRYYLGDKAAQYKPSVDKIADPYNGHDNPEGLQPDVVTATQLVIPTKTNVKLIITSRDVIHSFWIPALNGKADAVPGRFRNWKIEADEPGVYFGQCTEFCGMSHSRMRMQTVALSPDDFTKWVTDQQAPYVPSSASTRAWLDQEKKIAAKQAPTSSALPAPTDPIGAGISTFRSICTRCHLIRGINDDIYKGADQVSGAAPQLTHFSSRTTFAGGIFNLYNADGTWNRTALEAWLRNPPKEKDAYASGKRGMPNLGLSEDQISNLVEFLMSTGQVPNSDLTIPASEVK